MHAYFSWFHHMINIPIHNKAYTCIVTSIYYYATWYIVFFEWGSFVCCLVWGETKIKLQLQWFEGMLCDKAGCEWGMFGDDFD